MSLSSRANLLDIQDLCGGISGDYQLLQDDDNATKSSHISENTNKIDVITDNCKVALSNMKKFFDTEVRGEKIFIFSRHPQSIRELHNGCW